MKFRPVIIGIGLTLGHGLVFASPQRSIEFDVPPQPMSSALNAFARQSDLRVVFYTDVTDTMKSARVRGHLTPERALKILLDGADLIYEFADDSVQIWSPKDLAEQGGPGARLAQAAGRSSGSVPSGSSSSSSSVRPPAETVAPSAISSSARSRPESSDDKIEEVVVTGTHLRGSAPVGSPIIVFTQEDLNKSGAATAQQFLEKLPQQFGSRSSRANIVSPIATNFDPSFGSAVNLRGLGNGATLVLVNGRRSAAAGSAEYVDISSIPLSAIERIEVLTDGASAIYGSDAIGGVVNFVLKDTYSGADSLLQFGETDRGDGEQYRVAQTLGAGWSTGNVVANYEYFRQEPVWSADRAFSRDASPTVDLAGNETRHSFYVSAREKIAGNANVFGDSNYTEHTVSAFVDDETLGPGDYAAKSRQYGATLGASSRLGDHWRGDVTGTWNRNETNFDFILTDPNFAASSNNTKSAYSLWSVDTTINGPLLRLPTGDVLLAGGLGFRSELFDSRVGRSLATGQGGTRYAPVGADVGSAFVELLVPLLKERVNNASALTLSLAGRYEEHTRFGDSFNPKLGIAWEPIVGVKLRATAGNSFKAPTVYQLNPANDSVAIRTLADPSSSTGFTRSLVLGGNNSDLKEERATTWTLGTDIKFDVAGGTRISATYFDTDYRDRIAALPGTTTTSLTDASVAEFVVRRGMMSDSDFNALITGLLDGHINVSLCPAGSKDPVTGACQQSPSTFNAFVDRRIANIARLRTSGIDLELEQKFDLSLGQLAFRLNGSKVLDYEIRTTAHTSQIESVGTAKYPVELRARAGVEWVRGSWSASSFANYTDGYLNNLSTAATDVSSWTTVDFSFGYDLRRNRVGKGGVTLRLNVTNAFDRNPPLFVYPTNLGLPQIGFDPINANPFGRQYSATARISW